MAQQNRTTLKTYFETGDTPTEGQFIDLIDSLLISADFEPVHGTGATVLFDNNKGGRVYNAAAPSSAATVTLDFTGAVDGGMVKFYSDGTEVTISSSKSVYVGGAQDTGSVGILFLLYDATNDSVTANWVPSASAGVTQLSTPAVALVAGNTEIDYTLSSIDANATGGVFTYDTNSDFSTESAVPGWSFGTTTGTVTSLSNGTTYYFRFKVTASGYTDSAFGSDSGTPEVGATILFSDTFAGTSIDTAKWNTYPSADFSITQNDGLLVTGLTTNPSPTLAYFDTVGKFSVATAGKVVAMTFKMNNAGATDLSVLRDFRFGSGSGGLTDGLRFARNSTNNNQWDFTIRINGSETTADKPSGVATDTPVKVVIDSNVASFYSWNGSAWVLETTGASDDNTYELTFNFSAESVTGEFFELEYIYVTEGDFTGVTP